MNTPLVGQGSEPSAPAFTGFASLGHGLHLADAPLPAWLGQHAIPFDAGGMFGRFSAILEHLAAVPNRQVSMDPVSSRQTPPKVLARPAPTSAPIVATSDHLALHTAITNAFAARPKGILVSHATEPPSANALPPGPPCQEATNATPRTEVPSRVPEQARTPQLSESPPPQARIWVELGDGATLVVRVASSSLSDEDLRRLQREAKRIAGDAGLVLDKLSVNGQDQIKPYVVLAKDPAWHWHR